MAAGHEDRPPEVGRSGASPEREPSWVAKTPPKHREGLFAGRSLRLIDRDQMRKARSAAFSSSRILISINARSYATRQSINEQHC
jgi:hypothetical protein